MGVKRLTCNALNVVTAVLLLLMLAWASMGPTTKRPEVNPPVDQNPPSQLEKLEESGLTLLATELPAPPVSQPNGGDKPPIPPVELGQGPNIELLWPQDPRQQEQLYRYLHRCKGMRLGLLDNRGVTLLEPNQPGTRLSQMVRLAGSTLTKMEQKIIQGQTLTGQPVRLLPEQFDQLLIHLLHNKIGAEFSSSRQIKASYQLLGSRLSLNNFMLDGRPLSLQISLGGSCKQI